MSFPLAHGDLLSVLLKIYGLPETNRVAMRGRLQHAQKMGFPPGANTGKGRPAKYHAGEVLALGLMFELFQFGITPERAVSLLQYSAKQTIDAFNVAYDIFKRKLHDRAFAIVFPQELDRALGKGGSPALIVTTSSGFFLGDRMERGPRFAAVNVSALLDDVLEAAQSLDLTTREEFREDLRLWLLERGEDGWWLQ